MRCCLNWANSAFAVGSPDSITFCEERMNDSSQARVRRSVTPLRSGPTFTPLPNVWQAVQRWLKIFFASAGPAALAVEELRTRASARVAIAILGARGLPVDRTSRWPLRPVAMTRMAPPC
jgi:hypothetical protein